MAGRIEDYGLIGDLETAALVSRDGAVDWLCLPRFDSGAIFAALLGDSENGHWTIQPAGEFRSVRRQYRGDTLVLETELETDDGVVRLIDFMPPRETNPDLVRIVEGVSGRVEMRMELALRFDYGSIVPWVRTIEGTLVAIAGPDAVLLRTPIEHEGRNLRTARVVHGRRGRARAVRPALVPVQRAHARADRSRGRAREDARVLGGVGGTLHVRRHAGTTPSTARCSR